MDIVKGVVCRERGIKIGIYLASLIKYLPLSQMIAHALSIIKKELNGHLQGYEMDQSDRVELQNMAEGLEGAGGGPVPWDKIVLMFVNAREEKALKNLPNYVRNDVTLRASYENPPVFLNFLLLATATQTKYNNALLYLSRVIRFFQSKNVFTHDNVLPASLVMDDPKNPLDQLETFKLILDFYSPTLEEVNHLWGTLGGKQYPSVLYMLRMIDLKFKVVQSESGLITEVVSDFYHKKKANN